jgi:RNA recognition motif-containing protein
MDTPTPVSEPANRIFVGNLSFRTTDQDLGQAFAGCGEIKSALVITRGRRSLGYGFVVFTNVADAENAVEQHKNLKILDREVKLELAKNRDNIKPREERSPSSENQTQQGGNNDSNQDQVPQKRRTRNRNRNRNRNKNQNQNFNGNFGYQGNSGYPNFAANSFNPPFSNNPGRTYGSVVSGHAQFPQNNFNNFNSGGFPQNSNFNPPFSQNQNNRNPRRGAGTRGPSNVSQNVNNNTSSNTNVNSNFDNYDNNGPRQRNRQRRNQGGIQDNRQPQQDTRQSQPRVRPEPREKIPSTTTLYVTNLPFSCTDDGLFEIFKDCKPKSAHIVFTRNGRSRGYGFVEFEDETAQKKALDSKNNSDVPDGSNSRTIQVSVSHSTGKLADDGQDHNTQ